MNGAKIRVISLGQKTILNSFYFIDCVIYANEKMRIKIKKDWTKSESFIEYLAFTNITVWECSSVGRAAPF